ncbi:MAG: hypothetical protein WCK86_21630 [Planctomycetia bacterium]
MAILSDRHPGDHVSPQGNTVLPGVKDVAATIDLNGSNHDNSWTSAELNGRGATSVIVGGNPA